jgi:hypothetical protein
LFLWGEHDVFMHPRAVSAWDAIAARNPNVHVIRIPDAAHLPWLDDPEQVVAEIERFLAIEPRSAAETVAQAPPRSSSATAKANATA